MVDLSWNSVSYQSNGLSCVQGGSETFDEDKLSFQFKALHLTATDRVSRNYWLILMNPKLYPCVTQIYRFRCFKCARLPVDLHMMALK